MQQDLPQKECKIHGILTPENIKPQRNINKNGISITYRCRLCFRAADLKSYHKYAEAKRPATRARRKHYKNKETRYELEQVKLLADRYIVKKLIGTTNLKYATLKELPELIAIKRNMILLKRILAENKKDKLINATTRTHDPQT